MTTEDLWVEHTVDSQQRAVHAVCSCGQHFCLRYAVGCDVQRIRNMGFTLGGAHLRDHGAVK